MSRIRWIAFDAVGTLIAPDPPVAEVYHAAGRRYGSRLTKAEVARRFREAFTREERRDLEGLTPDDWNRRDVLQTNELRERDRWRAIVCDVFGDVVDREACLNDLWTHFAEAQSWRCYGDVAPALERLRSAGLRLAVASNFDERLSGICEALPELASLDVCMSSTRAGYRKPSGRFFLALCETVRCGPHEVLVVGDDEINDVRAARNAGLHSRLIERARKSPSADKLSNLDDLFDGTVC